ncbi:MAG: DUF4339 domain-containing protein [Planctomycetota bacterium]|nr:DUF4339 domain-containing protein [Planctomycetota bacterium]
MSCDQWFYTKQDKQEGPVTTDELKQMARAGIVTRDCLVWQEGWPDWRHASSVEGMFPTPPPIPRGTSAKPTQFSENIIAEHLIRNGVCERCGCSETYITSMGKSTCSGGNVKAVPGPAPRATKQGKRDASVLQKLGCVVLFGVTYMLFVNETRGIVMIFVLGGLVLIASFFGQDEKE